MEKECEICGVFFEARRKNQKYCPDCGKHAENKKKIMYTNISKSIARCGTGRPVTPIANICKNCGNTFESWIYKGNFCSDICKDAWMKKNTFCAFCGKSYTDGKIVKGVWFCSEECKKKNERKIAKEKGLLKACAFCGNEYIGKNSTFCSIECYQKALRSGWRPSSSSTKTLSRYCKNCGKEHLGGFCSNKCEQEFARKEKEREALVRRIAERRMIPVSHTKKTASVKREKKGLREYVEENGLCSVCRTSYMDCERMSSDFRYSPKGAVFKGSLVVKCPKFKK